MFPLDSFTEWFTGWGKDLLKRLTSDRDLSRALQVRNMTLKDSSASGTDSTEVQGSQASSDSVILMTPPPADQSQLLATGTTGSKAVHFTPAQPVTEPAVGYSASEGITTGEVTRIIKRQLDVQDESNLLGEYDDRLPDCMYTPPGSYIDGPPTPTTGERQDQPQLSGSQLFQRIADSYRSPEPAATQPQELTQSTTDSVDEPNEGSTDINHKRARDEECDSKLSLIDQPRQKLTLHHTLKLATSSVTTVAIRETQESSTSSQADDGTSPQMVFKAMGTFLWRCLDTSSYAAASIPTTATATTGTASQIQLEHE